MINDNVPMRTAFRPPASVPLRLSNVLPAKLRIRPYRKVYGKRYKYCKREPLLWTVHILSHHVSQCEQSAWPLPLGRRAQSLRMPPPPYFLRAKVHCSIPTEAMIVGFEQSAQRCPVSRPLLEELGHELPFPRWVLTGNVRWRAIRFELGQGGKDFEIVGAQKL